MPSEAPKSYNFDHSSKQDTKFIETFRFVTLINYDIVGHGLRKESVYKYSFHAITKRDK